MVIIRSKSQLTNQIEKAKLIRPLVKIAGLRTYKVRGTRGNFYTVEFRLVDGKRHAICDCAAGEHNIACHHFAACLGIHIERMRAILEQRIAA